MDYDDPAIACCSTDVPRLKFVCIRCIALTLFQVYFIFKKIFFYLPFMNFESFNFDLRLSFGVYETSELILCKDKRNA